MAVYPPDNPAGQSVSDAATPALTRRQVRAVDQRAVAELHIPSLILMENAGKNAADSIRRTMGSTPRRALVFCGTGNNGGDGLVVARHLYNARWEVRVILVGDAQRMTADAATNHDIVSRMGVPVEVVRSTEDLSNIGRQALGRQDIVIDALLGTGFSGIVREPMASVIAAINGATVKLIAAIDVPSGLDCDTGEIGNVATRADITITFVAPKPGFTHRQGPAHSGRVEVVDIGAPSALIDQVLAQDTT